MKIGIYDPYFDDLGGGEKYMMTIAECLSKQHEVSLFWDSEQDFLDFKKRFSLQLDTVKLSRNIFASGISLLNKIRETQKYDVIIVLSDGSIPFSLSKKLFLHVQQPLQHISGLSLKEKLKLKRVNGIFYNSQFTRAFNKKLFVGIKDTVIFPPVSLQIEKVTKENSILHVGRFRVQDAITGINDFKKQTVMIETFKKMVDEKKNRQWKFVLAASVKKEDEEEFSKLKKSAAGYPIEFLVNKTNDELWEVYNKAKIYWHASGFGEDLEKNPEYAEHFGISTVEAMGAGAVPVVINAGGQKEIVTNEEDGFLWSSLYELQNRTIRLMSDQKLWESMSQKAKIRAKDFSKEKFCEAINELIHS